MNVFNKQYLILNFDSTDNMGHDNMVLNFIFRPRQKKKSFFGKNCRFFIFFFETSVFIYDSNVRKSNEIDTRIFEYI